MIALLQRVSEARVDVDGQTIGQIGPGLLMLVCVQPKDTAQVAQRLLSKVLKLRVMADAAGKMNLSLQDTQGAILIVSQFTLAADTQSGTRPGFGNAAAPQLAKALCDDLVTLAQSALPGTQAGGLSRVQTGRFGAHMQVHLVNDGPVTIPMTVN